MTRAGTGPIGQNLRLSSSSSELLREEDSKVDQVHGSESNGELRHAGIRENVLRPRTNPQSRLPL